MMIISVWNTRGFNDPLKHGAVRNHVNLRKIDVMYPAETKIKKSKEASIPLKWRNWNCVSNADGQAPRRILLSWKPHVSLAVLESNAQHIHSKIDDEEWGSIHLTFVYGSNAVDGRAELWKKLLCIGSNMSGSWTILGDFNVVLNPMEICNNVETRAREDRFCSMCE